MQTWLISLLVNNHFGVLTRVTGLFSRRGYNIVSLSVGETNNPQFSRITIQTRADGAVIQQILKQLRKLEDARAVELLPGAETITRELLIVKLVLPVGRREALAASLEGFSYKTPYQDEGKIILEFTGESAECDKFLTLLSAGTILELSRTGVTALSTTGYLTPD